MPLSTNRYLSFTLHDTHNSGGDPVMRTLYVGMDIHKNFIQVTAMDETGTLYMSSDSKVMKKTSNDLLKVSKPKRYK